MAQEADRFENERTISEYAERGVLPYTPDIEHVTSTITRAMRPGIENVRQLTPKEVDDFLHTVTSKVGGITRRERNKITQGLREDNS